MPLAVKIKFVEKCASSNKGDFLSPTKKQYLLSEFTYIGILLTKRFL